jgi:hypothetical protein
MATVNIGTTKGNIIIVEFKNKTFKQITAKDVYKVAKEKYGEGVQVIGWAKVRHPNRTKNTTVTPN